MRIERRRKGSLVASVAPTALTAASAPVTDVNQIFKATGLGGRRNNWQDEAWAHYREVGELHYYVSWCGASCSKVRLVASEVDPVTGLPTGGIAEDNKEGLRVAEIVRGIAGGPQGQAQILRRTGEVLTVPGELWHAILARTETVGTQKRVVQKWYAITRAQILQGDRSDTVKIKLPDGSKHDFTPGVDAMYRVWNEDAEDASLPDSPVRAVLDSLREIVRTTKKIRNADNSRMNNNGILLIPSEASLPSSAAPISAGKPGDPAPTGPGQPVAPALQAMIVAAQLEGGKDEGSAASLVPIVIAAPRDSLKDVHHVDFGKDLTDMAIKTRNDGITRLAHGLNVSPERLLGIGSNSNHWSSRQISEEDVQIHIAPLVETTCQAMYDNVIRNVLAKEGIDPDKYTLWYDASNLTADPDLTDEAKAAFDGGAITAEAFVRLSGLPDDSLYDLTTFEGCQVAARDAVTKDPTLWPMLANLIGAGVEGVEFPQPALPQAGGAGESPADSPPAADEQEPATENGQSVVAAVGDQLGMAVDLMETRALELAGKRRVRTNDREQLARLRDVDAFDYHRYMDPVSDADVPGLIKGWDSGLDALAASYGFDAEQVRSVVRSRVRKQLTSKVVDA